MKLKHIALIGSLFPILFSLVLFFGVLISADSDDENSNFSSGITGMNLSAEVLKHQPMVEKYAREYGISEYVNVLLAIIQVESGGTAEEKLLFSSSLSALIKTPKKSTREKRIGNRLPKTAGQRFSRRRASRRTSRPQRKPVTL